MVKKSSKILEKFVIDYDNEDFPIRCRYTDKVSWYMFIVGWINPLALPFNIVSHHLLNKDYNDPAGIKVFLLSQVVNSVTINAVLFSLVTFFTLKKYAKEGSITNLANKDIAMISFIAVPAIAILFSAVITAILYKARESCSDEEDKYNYLLRDTCFTNPLTGIVMATAALVGTVQDKVKVNTLKDKQEKGEDQTCGTHIG